MIVFLSSYSRSTLADKIAIIIMSVTKSENKFVLTIFVLPAVSALTVVKDVKF